MSKNVSMILFCKGLPTTYGLGSIIQLAILNYFGFYLDHQLKFLASSVKKPISDCKICFRNPKL